MHFDPITILGSAAASHVVQGLLITTQSSDLQKYRVRAISSAGPFRRFELAGTKETKSYAAMQKHRPRRRHHLPRRALLSDIFTSAISLWVPSPIFRWFQNGVEFRRLHTAWRYTIRGCIDTYFFVLFLYLLSHATLLRVKREVALLCPCMLVTHSSHLVTCLLESARCGVVALGFEASMQAVLGAVRFILSPCLLFFF